MTISDDRRHAAVLGTHKGDSAKVGDPTEHQLGEFYDLLLAHYENTGQGKLADAMRYGIQGIAIESYYGDFEVVDDDNPVDMFRITYPEGFPHE